MARTYDYSTPDDDVRQMLSLVTDEIVDDSTAEYFIEKVDNYIDTRLSPRYDVPFTQSTAPPILTDISANLAAYRILKRLKIEVNDNEQNYVRAFKDDALKMLEEIVSGKADILDASGNVIQPKGQTGILSSTLKYKPIFDEGDESAWEVSDDKISDEQDKYNT